jgi:hypothetical protein
MTYVQFVITLEIFHHNKLIEYSAELVMLALELKLVILVLVMMCLYAMPI